MCTWIRPGQIATHVPGLGSLTYQQVDAVSSAVEIEITLNLFLSNWMQQTWCWCDCQASTTLSLDLLEPCRRARPPKEQDDPPEGDTQLTQYSSKHLSWGLRHRTMDVWDQPVANVLPTIEANRKNFPVIPKPNCSSTGWWTSQWLLQEAIMFLL